MALTLLQGKKSIEFNRVAKSFCRVHIFNEVSLLRIPVVPHIAWVLLFKVAPCQVTTSSSYSIINEQEWRDLWRSLKLEWSSLFTCSQSCHKLSFYETMYTSTQLHWIRGNDVHRNAVSTIFLRDFFTDFFPWKENCNRFMLCVFFILPVLTQDDDDD